MKIVMLESLAISRDLLANYTKPLEKSGHTFEAYERDDDPDTQIERCKDADILIIANMPLKGSVIESCPNLKFINVAFTGVDHVDLAAAEKMGIAVSNASGYSNDSVAELTICMMPVSYTHLLLRYAGLIIWKKRWIRRRRSIINLKETILPAATS